MEQEKLLQTARESAARLRPGNPAGKIIISAAYCTWHALRISKDPGKSLTGKILEPDQDMEELKDVKFPVRAVIVIGVMFACYMIYSVCAQKYDWDYEQMMAIMTLDAIFSAVVYRLNVNEASKTSSPARSPWAASP